MSVSINTPKKSEELFWQNGVHVEWSVSGYESDGAIVKMAGGSVSDIDDPAGGFEVRGRTEYDFSAGRARLAYRDGLNPDGRSIVRIAVWPLDAKGAYSGERAEVQFWLKEAAAPSAPKVTAPAEGSQHNVNDAIQVSWTYTGDLPQGEAYIFVSRDGSGAPWSQIGRVSGDGNSYTIPANTLRSYLASGARSTGIWISVVVRDTYGQQSPDSAVLINVLATYPDKPSPTAPVDGAQTYPTALTTFTASYTSYGGVALAETVIEWYKDGETAWSHWKSWQDSATSHTLPAGTFSVGKWYWRMRHENALGEISDWSDSRTLYSVSGIAITSPGSGAQIITPQAVTVQWAVGSLSGYSYDGFAVAAWKGGQWIKMAQVGRDATQAVIPAGTINQYYGGNSEYTAGYIGVAATDGGSILTGTINWVTIYTRQAHKPQPPTITAPAAGSQSYVNSAISVSWAYKGELPQSAAYIYVWVSGSGMDAWAKIGKVEGDGASYTIQPDVLRPYLKQGIRATGMYLQVSTYDTDWQHEASEVQIYVLSTTPDKPIPTAPADYAETYPTSETIFSAAYEDHGGLALIQTVIEWYKDGEAEWSHYKTFDDSETSHSLPAGTFALGTWHWRMRHRNAINEDGPWSDSRTLYSIASAPLRPTLTQPASGATVYNNAPVVFGWTYASSGVAQGGYTLKYNVAGSGWVTLTGSGADTTRAVDLAGQTGIVQWQVQVRNTLGEVSSWSAIGSFTLASSAPTATPTYPAGGFIDRHESQTFTWDYQSPINSAQGGYRIAWSVADSGEPWQYVSGSGSAAQHTFAADFFPEAAGIYWMVEVYDSAGTGSGFTASVQFSTQDVAPDAPTLLEPIGLYLPPDQDTVFRWRHNSSLGTPQGSAEIQWRLNAGQWHTVSVTGSADQAVVPAGTFAAGTISWQGRTANRDGDWGPWSQASTFGITGAPAMPTITQTYGTSRPGIDWLAPGQVVYQIEFADGSGKLLYQDTRLADGDAGSYRIPRYLMPGLVKIRLRVKNQYDSWSPWASTQIQVTDDGMDPPGISAYGDSRAGVIRVSVGGVDWATATRVILYRDGEPIALLTGGNYVDAGCAAGGHTYSVITEYAGTKIARSGEAAATLTLYAISLAPMDAPEDILWIRHDLDNPPGRELSISPETSRVSVAGRALPLAFFGEHLQRAYSISCAMDGEAVGRITAMLGGRVIYRDPDGRSDVCQISSMQGRAIPYAPMRRQVSIALDAVDVESFSIF